MWPRQYGRREFDRPAVRPVRSQSNQQSGHTHKSTDKRAWRGHIPSYPTRGALQIEGNRHGAGVRETWTPSDRLLRHHESMAGDGSGWSSDRLLELVRCDARAPCTPSPSTWSSSRSLQSLRSWKPRLEEGFALRCLQRLSFPDLATRRCPERDSRHTRGRSSPILSY